MFGARCHRLLKPLMKEFLIDYHHDGREQQLRQPHGDVIVRRRNAGSGQPHIMWPIEKYISTTRKPSDQKSLRFSFGVSWSSNCASASDGFMPRLCRP